MVVTSFVVDSSEDAEVVTTYVSSTGKHHYLCLHWISSTPISKTGFVGDGHITFMELIVHIGRFRKEFTLIGR